MAARVFTEDERQATVAVWREHGTSAAARWVGASPGVVRSWVLQCGFAVRGRGHPTSDESRRSQPRKWCRCAMCVEWQQKERERRLAELRVMERYDAGPSFDIVQYRGDDWRGRAECSGVDPVLFFTERGESTRPAKAVCSWCTVREACLEFALTGDEKFGIWGGTSERERRRLRSEARLKSSAPPRSHGTRSCYQSGCRDPQCVAANNAYKRDDRRGL